MTEQEDIEFEKSLPTVENQYTEYELAVLDEIGPLANYKLYLAEEDNPNAIFDTDTSMVDVITNWTESAFYAGAMSAADVLGKIYGHDIDAICDWLKENYGLDAACEFTKYMANRIDERQKRAEGDDEKNSFF